VKWELEELERLGATTQQGKLFVMSTSEEGGLSESELLVVGLVVVFGELGWSGVGWHGK